jgi:alcohol dehydrogenase
MEDIWIENSTITTGPVDTYSTPTCSRSSPTTHRFTLNDSETAYDVFGDPGATGALKVLLTASHG